MKKILKNSAAITVAAVLATSVFVPAVYAAEPSYNVGAAYSKSKYYDRLLAVKLTGDHRYDVVSVALSQLGYHEGNKTSEMHGLNSNGYGNFTEYNRIIGTVGGSFGFEWCAAFVSWCLRQAGVPDSVSPTEASCSRMVDLLTEKGVYVKRSSGYSPVAGDLIFFRASTSVYYSSHVGIVVGERDGYVYTVEGNNGGEVNYHKYDADSPYILGYGVPQYAKKAGIKYDFELKEEYFESGVFEITEDLNLRTGPATTYTSLGKIPKGTKVAVSDGKNGWARVTYGGKSGWCSLDYMRWAGELEYVLRYDANGGEGAPAPQSKPHGSSVRLSKSIPDREGYVFIGWSDAVDGSAEYFPGEEYRANADLKLFAVWERKTYSVVFYDSAGNEFDRRDYAHGEPVTLPEAPQKEDDLLYVYEFSGWSPEVPDTVTENLDLHPVYDKKSKLSIIDPPSDSMKFDADSDEKSVDGDGFSLASAIAALISGLIAFFLGKRM